MKTKTTMTAKEFIQLKTLQKERDIANGKPIYFKEPGGRGRFGFRLQAFTFMEQHNLPTKVFVFERLSRFITGEETFGAYRNPAEGEIQYRIGYWIVGKQGRAKGRWVWGQYSPLLPVRDMKALFRRALKDGTLRPRDFHQLGN